ncbi:GGDEF domain-containing protein [Aminipila terrae]|uniref:Diguanylate cyclase n=1 Tax=Aminipila terrae TaxID=2697030 RepID=A0A6P1MAU9_9FIRM|nr:GGDEF domain-containing protein [Aminipila terrae]QHI71750.1 diguanylate cyclase [Aminipila terrae]
MQDFGADLLRGTVSSIMNIVLIFVLAKPKYSKKVTLGVMMSVFLVNILTSIYFYTINDLTMLAKFDIFLFVGFSIYLKPFVMEGIFQWIFNSFTAINIFFIIVFVSYHLAQFFPYPYYSNTIIRLLLYIVIIGLFLKFVSPFYQQVMENWKMYFLLVISIFLNFMYYIVSADDIQKMLDDKFVPMLLLIIMSSLIYIIIFYLQQKSIANCLLNQEKQHYKDLAYTDKLTGVQNRNGYENFISCNLKENCESVCIGIYDINNLKAINDSFGHEVGDKFISDASRIICKAFRKSAVFRIGGDEFVSVSINVSENEIKSQHKEMIYLLKEYNYKTPYNIDLDIAFGYAFQRAPVSVDKLFVTADRNMYINKTDIKNVKISMS